MLDFSTKPCQIQEALCVTAIQLSWNPWTLWGSTATDAETPCNRHSQHSALWMSKTSEMWSNCYYFCCCCFIHQLPTVTLLYPNKTIKSSYTRFLWITKSSFNSFSCICSSGTICVAYLPLIFHTNECQPQNLLRFSLLL